MSHHSPLIQQLLGAAKAAVIEAKGLEVQFFTKPPNQLALRDLVDEIDRLTACYDIPARPVPASALPGSEYEPYEPSPYNGDYSED